MFYDLVVLCFKYTSVYYEQWTLQMSKETTRCYVTVVIIFKKINIFTCPHF